MNRDEIPNALRSAMRQKKTNQVKIGAHLGESSQTISNLQNLKSDVLQNFFNMLDFLDLEIEFKAKPPLYPWHMATYIWIQDPKTQKLLRYGYRKEITVAGWELMETYLELGFTIVERKIIPRGKNTRT